MVSNEHNKQWWAAYDWDDAGDEWSLPWGGANALWHGSLMPRIHHYLPAVSILEIACGYGRWTQYLRRHCDQLVAVDLAENCVEACKRRFAGDERLTFVTNDGLTLTSVAGASIDFAFSFDSLVHVDTATISSYLAELRRVLKPGGVAFIHHSNLGAFPKRYQQLASVPLLPGALRRLRVVEYGHMRDASVTAEFVAAEVNRHGLRCVGQEIIPWLTSRTLIDCISVIVPDESPARRANRIVRNKEFSGEPRYVSRLASVYGPDHAENGRPS